MNTKEKEVVAEFVKMVRYYLDPDEPQAEWEDGVLRAMEEVELLLGDWK